MAPPTTQTGDVVSFGPFRVMVRKRLVTRAGAHVELGARVFDTLMALVSRPNEVVSKTDLLAQAWSCGSRSPPCAGR